jgi:hypothetical protein
MTLRIEWRHLRGPAADPLIEYVTRPTRGACMDYWSEQVDTYRRVLWNTTFTSICSFVGD